MSAQPAFDTAEMETRFRAAGFTAKQATSLREALLVVVESATMNAASPAQLEASEQRIMSALEKQGAAIAKQATSHSEGMTAQAKEIYAAVALQGERIGAQSTRFSEALRVQGWSILGGVSVVVGIAATISTVILKLG